VITVRVSPDAFDIGAELGALGGAGIGAVASFTGIVRADDGLTALTLEHYPGMTEAALLSLADEASARWALADIVIHHRVGCMLPGDPIVLVACASAHRKDALEACAFLIDRLKTDAPFWKRETFCDGQDRWVDARASDDSAAARWR
jgi:molybdopterin synthase catalytic subunit